jgi:alkylation response protein AidB-like acyl-CoA dehydrogenase
VTAPAPAADGQLADAQFEEQMRAWVIANLPTGWRQAALCGDEPAVAAMAADDAVSTAWFRSLGEAGLGTPTWPACYGGASLTSAQADVLAEVLGSFGASVPEKFFTAVTHAGPTILAHGDEDMKAAFLPAIAAGRQVWCQLFSEPDAGSDLASLSTRAVWRDGFWRVTGQKVWTSYGRVADYGILLARTDPDVPKHDGLTYFLLDMHAPGVTARPIRQITGATDFDQVFLDDVPVPDSCRVGPVGAGWRIALGTLTAERDGLSRPRRQAGALSGHLARRAASQGRWDDGQLRATIVELWIRERSIELLAMARPGGPDASAARSRSSVAHLAHVELEQTAAEIGHSLDGMQGAFWAAGVQPQSVHDLLYSRCLSIAGGTSEIQRNIIAERILGLPKDAGVPRGVPWSRVRRSRASGTR